MWILAVLAIGTLVSEDASLAGAAGLAQVGVVSPLTAGTAVALGIWIGDLGLYLVGRLVWRWPPAARWVTRRWRHGELQALSRRLERRAGLAILLSRVLPGTRLPLYVAAGVFGLRGSVFATSTAVGAALWTGAIIGGVQWLR